MSERTIADMNTSKEEAVRVLNTCTSFAIIGVDADGKTTGVLALTEVADALMLQASLRIQAKNISEKLAKELGE